MTEEAKHTPGPWRVKRIDYPRGMDVSFEVLAGREELVVQTIMREVGKGWRDDIIATDAANSKLIAAAPDMFAALQLIRSRLDEVTCSHECAVIDAAITKATAV